MCLRRLGGITVVLPLMLMPAESASQSALYAVVTDGDGLQTLERYRIP